MKKWPKKDDKPVLFRSLVKGIREALLFAYDLNRKNEDKDIPYAGYETNLPTDFEPIEKLTVENLTYDLKEQDRDALDVILGIAIQLGIEQGKRNFKSSTVYHLMKIRLSMIEVENPPSAIDTRQGPR